MKKKNTNIVSVIVLIVVVAVLVIAAFTTDAKSVQKTFWALVPPIIAIVLALVTKEVYSSLFIGIVVGGLLYSGFSFPGTIKHVFTDGIVAQLTDAYNVGILIFLVILGIMVCLMNKSGGSAAFGRWAQKHIKTKKGAQFATIVLGILIFIDDYFNCLTVGSVMLPVTDRFKISRAKLAYLIDATAAPVCIIAPISSWAAAVSGFVPGNQNGIALFCSCIPWNFYALFTIAFMFAITAMQADYGLMEQHELNATTKGDLFTTPERPYAEADKAKLKEDGKLFDMLIPVIVLIICCVIGMLWSGGMFSGKNFVEAFANSDASVGLAVGSFFALIITLVIYMARRVMNFTEFMACVPDGFAAMIAPILILTFAWSLKGMTDSLGASVYVAGLIKNTAGSLMNLLPFIIFLIAVGLAFATGTSWGTFGILIPIVVTAFKDTDPNLMIIAMSACMAGAVCGDHCSPISDTTIMASAGAQCYHINHVNTQLPYAMTVAAISAVTYIVAGFSRNVVVSLVFGFVVLIVLLYFLKKREQKKYGAAWAD
ncbi:Na+/H+ antiporter NhaC family protein [Hornefia butyriciproducens]|uniref:Na+/H+ antiporter NhaC family protein n=1 Tax=Hornefia butyriciproducens TaxID=2652293 RepID=A0A6L5Y8I9_9FIRM|nr:Na+/H+ antiporter NhaC family protein [Hornefia butyriciproducens]MDD6298507.1 Na+/H+ antiporter NhaC family protein [Hornefia butyriciproducens]MDY2990982.1 Na+/H+ antiporter NhaC family protein [Hornefia butyriciproducens]MST52825.1 Na+/H+ antiporter NhaC family protein [Hornefia butyriciproducens]